MRREMESHRAKAATALLLVFCGFLSASAAWAGRGPFDDRIHPGHYSGGGFPSTPVDFGVSADRHRVKNFKSRVVLDCKQNGRYVGDLTVRRFVVDKIPIQRAPRGGRFADSTRVRFEGGGYLQLKVRGILIAPERARGYITAHARLPDDITCRPAFGPIDWRARFVG